MRKARAAAHTTVQHVKKASSAVRRHYWLHMPARKWHRIVLWTVFLGVSTVIGVQMAYPLDRALPLATVASKRVTLATHSEMAQAIVEAFDTSKLQLVLGDNEKKSDYDLKLAGAEPNTEEMIARLSNYPFWQRFIPGSILWQPAQITIGDVFYTDTVLQKFATARSEEFSFAVENAHLAIKDGAIQIAQAVPGSSVDVKALRDRISEASIAFGGVTTIQIPAKRVPPTKTAADLVEVRDQAEKAVAHAVIINAAGQKFTPDSKEIAAWLRLSDNEQSKTIVSVDKDKVKSYLQTINDKVGVSAGQTNINIVNGVEVGRTTGAVGKTIDIDAIANELAAKLLESPPDIAISAQFIDLQPSVIYNSKYTTTLEGLQAYVTDTANQRDMSIVVRQLDGDHWYAHARDTESMPSASTFKLYLAKILFDKIDAGEIHWDDPILDTNVAGCFERMTVASTNPCAESWIAQWGREYIDNYVYRLGFSTGTSFNTGWAVETTADDLNMYMLRLYNGTILSGANRDRLLDSLGRHPYRYGIPTGSAGIVHDKVGFLWDYVHDTAIVQHPRGTYILTVMSKGQSYAAIAAVTREIERIMYP